MPWHHSIGTDSAWKGRNALSYACAEKKAAIVEVLLDRTSSDVNCMSKAVCTHVTAYMQ